LFAKDLDVRDALMRLIEPVVEARGLELVDVEFVKQGRGGVLRIFIDRAADADGAGVTVDDCAQVSHAVSEVLETEDPIKGNYTLEVSSPGFDRILRKREHYARFVGTRVLVELKLPQDGRRRFIGNLTALETDSIVVVVDGTTYRLPFDRIQKARLRPE
jgi:ribosome maturation factor RimP